jgi:hypothetical protein
MSQKPLYRIAIVAVLAVAVVVILSSKKPQTETPAAQAVDSKYERGVLKITLPRVKEDLPKKIKIS